jgi:hypothetical protein
VSPQVFCFKALRIVSNKTARTPPCAIAWLDALEPIVDRFQLFKRQLGESELPLLSSFAIANN